MRTLNRKGRRSYVDEVTHGTAQANIRVLHSITRRTTKRVKAHLPHGPVLRKLPKLSSNTESEPQNCDRANGSRRGPRGMCSQR